MLDYKNDGGGLRLNVVRVPTPMSYSEKVKYHSTFNWQKKIRSLGRDFCIPQMEIETIISEVEMTPAAAYSGIYYDRAWKMLMSNYKRRCGD